MQIETTQQDRQSYYQGCLLGGAVGDALGAPVEFLSRADIVSRYGSVGIREYTEAYGKTGAITDDTQMTLFTAEGVVRSWVRAYVHAPCAIPSAIAMAYQRWLHSQGQQHPLHKECLSGWLLTQRALYARRAPGNTCLSGLEAMQMPDDLASNDSKGCGGVMRVAPIGMYYATLATQSPESRHPYVQECFDMGCTVAAITHGHPTGQLASGAFAALIMQLLLGMELAPAVESLIPLLTARTHHEETLAAINLAVTLSAQPTKAATVPTELGGGWVAEEALAIALYCTLCSADFRSGVVLAVNHSGDSDSTGSMAGQLLGAMHGVQAIPATWLDALELKSVVVSMADDLAMYTNWQRDAGAALQFGDSHRERYPHG